MPGAFFGRYRLMAIDGTVFNTPETDANTQAGCRAVAINIGQGLIGPRALYVVSRVREPCSGRALDRPL
jgi:hypothetical protein